MRAEGVVATSSPNHPEHPIVLNNLGLILGCLFDRTGNRDHLQQAILRAQEALSALPMDHPERVNYCNNLCNMLALRYQLSGDIDDLKQAMLQTEEAVTVFPLEHPKRARAHSTLSSLLRMKFYDTNDLDALQQAITWAEEAVNAFPLDHPDRAVRMKHLGMLLNSRYEHAENPHDHERAIQCFRECVAQHSANPTQRINASILVASILEKDKKWADASEIRGIGVNLLTRVSSRSLGRKDLQPMIKQFSTGVASDAAAAAVQAGKSASDAVQLLELGRGVIANLQIETRTDLTDLSEQHPQIANDFEQLRDQLDSSNLMPSNAAETTAQGSSRRHTASLEMDKTIDRIRQLPNFERFLLPPTADELMTAAGPLHPLVLINISPIRCDAFLIQQQDITVLSLPRLHERTINGVASVMRSPSPTKYQMLDLLKWLSDVMAGPVLDQLGFREAVTTEESQWPRVCWIPTGPLCALPIHAAGYHDEAGSRTVLDRVISSYSPSIKALLYARRNTAQRNPNRGLASDKTDLVSMRTTPGCGGLAFAGEETKMLNNLLPSSIPRMTLHEPLKHDVLTALDGCSVFHFAGHGLSDPSDPSMSTLLMGDWQTDPLNVKDLVAMKFHQNPPLLAYLSACSTAANQDTKLLDEGIHLMGACQLAGFRHVIGSLWEVSDKHCVDAAKDVYKTMIQADMSDESVSQGLHNAVLNLRGKRGRTGTTREARDARLIETEENQESSIGDPFIWSAYIHMGI
jgi:CHAT domain-containing protein